MSFIKRQLLAVKKELPEHVHLVAVSKTKPLSDLQQAYDAGQRIFGENKIQEMTGKWEALPKDIQWHMIGHVQTNKVKYMAPYVDTIHAVDSLKLLKEINKQAQKHGRIINCLLQVKIASEDSKFGLSADETIQILSNAEVTKMQHIHISGLMGMATFTDNRKQIQQEFLLLKNTFDQLQNTHSKLKVLSMGMSGDYELAITCGSTMVRIGSAIFGARNYNQTL